MDAAGSIRSIQLRYDVHRLLVGKIMTGFDSKRRIALDRLDDDDIQVYVKPRLDQGPDYERGFVDGMMYQTQYSVDKAVNRMAQLAQPVQEPVAWEWRYDSCGHAVVNRLVVTETPEPTLFLKNVFARGPFPLYTAPPPHRPTAPPPHRPTTAPVGRADR
jgi:hypothetical protein